MIDLLETQKASKVMIDLWKSNLDGRIATAVEDLPRLHELDGDHVELRSAFGI